MQVFLKVRFIIVRSMPNIGYAFMTNKFYLPNGASGHPRKGMDWQVGYDWVSRSGFGAGLMYSGYKSSYKLFPCGCECRACLYCSSVRDETKSGPLGE